MSKTCDENVKQNQNHTEQDLYNRVIEALKGSTCCLNCLGVFESTEAFRNHLAYEVKCPVCGKYHTLNFPARNASSKQKLCWDCWSRSQADPKGKTDGFEDLCTFS